MKKLDLFAYMPTRFKCISDILHENKKGMLLKEIDRIMIKQINFEIINLINKRSKESILKFHIKF